MRIVSVNVRPRTVTWRGRPVTTAISCVKLGRRESGFGRRGRAPTLASIWPAL
jgi:hypothetical protein